MTWETRTNLIQIFRGWVHFLIRVILVEKTYGPGNCIGSKKCFNSFHKHWTPLVGWVHTIDVNDRHISANLEISFLFPAGNSENMKGIRKEEMKGRWGFSGIVHSVSFFDFGQSTCIVSQRSLWGCTWTKIFSWPIWTRRVRRWSWNCSSETIKIAKKCVWKSCWGRFAIRGKHVGITSAI